MRAWAAQFTIFLLLRRYCRLSIVYSYPFLSFCLLFLCFSWESFTWAYYLIKKRSSQFLLLLKYSLRVWFLLLLRLWLTISQRFIIWWLMGLRDETICLISMHARLVFLLAQSYSLVKRALKAFTWTKLQLLLRSLCFIQFQAQQVFLLSFWQLRANMSR